MFKRRPNKQPKIETLVGAKTRINGDVQFTGGFHLDGFINGNVRGDAGAVLSVSEQGCVEGSVSVPRVVLNGVVKGDIAATDRVELGPKARVLGNVHYTTIETAIGAQINGKLIHRAPASTVEAETDLAGVKPEPSS